MTTGIRFRFLLPTYCGSVGRREGFGEIAWYYTRDAQEYHIRFFRKRARFSRFVLIYVFIY